MPTKNIAILLVFILASVHCIAQDVKTDSPGDPYNAAWKRLDSLLQKDLPKSAEKVADNIYKDAKEKKLYLYVLKSQLYLLQIHQATAENGDSVSIAEAKHYLAAGNFPYCAIWQSIAAEMYWNYYEAHRYEIQYRTTVKQDSTLHPDDCALWDAKRFFDTISSLYLASLQHPERLKQNEIRDYYPILYRGKNTAT